MVARQQTSIRNKDAFGPSDSEQGGSWQDRSWKDLRNFTASIDPGRLRIPDNARSQIWSSPRFRLDMQGKFTEKGHAFYNLQIQDGTQSVFAVYVQVSGYQAGTITNAIVTYRIHQSAVHKTEHTTMYVDQQGSVKWEPVKTQECVSL